MIGGYLYPRRLPGHTVRASLSLFFLRNRTFSAAFGLRTNFVDLRTEFDDLPREGIYVTDLLGTTGLCETSVEVVDPKTYIGRKHP